MSLRRCVSFLGFAILFAAGIASAQSASTQDQSSTTGFSSSLAGLSESGLQLAEFTLPDGAFPGSPSSAGGGSAAGQYGGGEGYGGGRHGLLHKLTFEAGGGFNGPIGNDTGNGAGTSTPVLSWGGNFTVGGGLRFNKRLSVLAEYQFMDNKLPAALLAEFPAADQITAGNAHINSITGSPVVHLFPERTNGVYLVGGFGWYHKSTNFQTPETTFDEFGDEFEVNVTVASFTSNQWGGNAGLGIYHRLGGGLYGGDTSHTELFAEARYTFIHTPKPEIQDDVNVNNGLGTTEVIPVTFGVRF